jgi:RNA polymerase sigma factor (sigma-70 family)
MLLHEIFWRIPQVGSDMLPDMSETDIELLACYARQHSEDAFAELVRRHLGLVYSAALRQVRSPQLAEEVSQSVFTDLARNAARLKPDTLLTAWLYQVTRRTAIDVVRREVSRQLREQIAAEMNAMNATTADWAHIEPLLDEAMHALDDTDRAAVLLRYFENKSLRQVGDALGASENAAQKRLTRAVERLREFFVKRGVTAGASGLVVVISANAVQAAPAGLAVTISTAAAFAGTTVAVTATATVAKAIAMTTLQKIIVAAALTVLVGAGIYKARQFSQLRGQARAPQPQPGNITPRMADRTINRVQGWSSDIDFLLEAIKRNHYVYRSKPLPAATGKVADELKRTIGTMSDERVVAELLRLMATLGDGHCYVFPSEAFTARRPFRQLPLRLYQFADGLFVIDAERGHERWIGRKITRLGTVATEEALRRVADYVPSDNRYSSRILGPIFCGHRGILEMLGLGVQADKVVFQFAGPNRNSGEERIGFVPLRKLSQTERKLLPSRLAGAPPAPLYLRNTGTNFWFEALPQGKVVYFQFNQVLDAPEESIETFSARLDASLRQQRPGLLIVDVRNNNGGDASLLDPLIGTLQDFERRDSAAKLVVIAGTYTFSAAQIFIARMDNETKAVFAGEPSASKPNFVGEDDPHELPWSRLAASISNRYHESIPGDTREWIEPDIKVELSSRDYFAQP